MNRKAVAFALSSAVLFGLSTPAAKLLLATMTPAVLAGLLYCGAGGGIAILRRFRAVHLADRGNAEAALETKDWPWLGGAILAGGVVGPLLLMFGLSHTEAAAASLLLTFEGVATALLAWFVFQEHFDRRIALGLATLVAGAIILSWTGTPSVSGLLGPLAIVGACVAWGLDNNLTRQVSLADPLHIVELKGLIAGPANLLIGLWAGGTLPGIATIGLAGLVGFVGYGASLVLFVFAMRELGTARTGAYFSVAPFIGAIASVLVLQEAMTFQLLTAGLLMGVGVWLHLSEHHDHEHEHEPMEHAHRHVHDEHHEHGHSLDDPPGEPHTHRHSHQRMRHEHPHTPDMHHTHGHEK